MTITVGEQWKINIQENKEKLKKIETFALAEDKQRHTCHCYSLYNAGVLRYASLNMSKAYSGNEFKVTFISHDGTSIGSLSCGSLILSLDMLYELLEKLN